VRIRRTQTLIPMLPELLLYGNQGSRPAAWRNETNVRNSWMVGKNGSDPGSEEKLANDRLRGSISYSLPFFLW